MTTTLPPRTAVGCPDPDDYNETSRPASEFPASRSEALGGNPNSTVGQCSSATQRRNDDRGPTPARDHSASDAHESPVTGGSDSRQASNGASPIEPSPAGSDAGRDRTAKFVSTPTDPALFDPALALAADVLDDLESVRIANENRLRQLTRSVEDKDGETRGFGLDESNPAVARLAVIVETLGKVETDAAKNLEKQLRTHPLHPWIKAQRGLGDKQVARLLAAIGDPYWNDLHQRPRTVSELWAYCGFHVLHPGGHEDGDSHRSPVAGVAPKRQRGAKSNWSETARKRAWLIANSVVKAGGPYREVYDATKAKYADAVHTSPCVRCGPSGKPAQPGSPLSKAHIHARGMRAIAKAVLKDLWRESKRLHNLADGHNDHDNQTAAAVRSQLPGDHTSLDDHSKSAAGNQQ